MPPVSGLEVLQQRVADARTALDELVDHSSARFHDINAGSAMLFVGWNNWQWTPLPDAAQPAVRHAREATERLRDFARAAVRVAAVASLGDGFVITGRVRAAKGCRPLAGVPIQVWLATETGGETDNRATVRTGEDGRYRIETEAAWAEDAELLYAALCTLAEEREG